jgi:DNA-binding protein HU-beta
MARTEKSVRASFPRKPRIFAVFGLGYETGRVLKSFALAIPAQKGAGPVNKNDLIQHLSDRSGLPKNDAAKAVDGVFDIITDALKKGDEVRLTGFGVFVVAQRKGGKGRNPQTGEEITIKASKQPRFRAGKQLKDAVN